MSIVLGSLTALLALGAVAAGATMVVVDRTARDPDGLLMTDPKPVSTRTYALMSDTIGGGAPGAELDLARDLLGTVRVRTASDQAVFIGIGPSDQVATYLGSVGSERAADLGDGGEERIVQAGGAPRSLPATETFWAASTQGGGERMLAWDVRPGDWTAVAMNADGTPNVSADLSIGARLPSILWIGLGLLGASVLLTAMAAGLIYLGIPRRSERRA